ncbi:ABC transporter ATP-binding protein [Pseudorhodobacter sp.]|uniref:ABC transporter ATP-binding protein n=1 Tax=Pseudorhodobacter sp. TaxID=1934400 RepID=UPI002647A337|nr:sn-glycerol-3-phosphate ABC transporter ATP-binding protein UgpC [Pseudorhodobacter sp.]MDN5787581.1 sn-glycerol-3-phosphate ABC transporter ATP-binding protein UgpC [Pseudorhodobacter sp.]
MAKLTVENLTKSFGAVKILHGLNADIADGEFIAVLGESGCGKSTFLRIIAGLEDATSGAITIDGKNVTEQGPRDRDIAMVFQSYALYPHMTVKQNIDFPLELMGLDKAERERRIADTAELLNLTPYLDRKPRDLSGGQRQRVAMGRAIVREPKVFLFDEPLSNLDAKLRVQMRSEIRNLQQRLHVTAIYVTHDQVEALTMADRVMLMNGGRIEQFAPPLELYDRPASVFVASFVGTPPMNLVDGQMKAGTGIAALDTVFPYDAPTSQDVTLGFRPEHVRIATAQDAHFSGKLLSTENTGDRLNLVLLVAGQEVRVSLNERHDLTPGDIVACRVLDDHIHLFDRSTGARIN